MKRRWLPATLLLVTGTLLASVFKWFDEEGGVHYGDCPPLDCSAEPVELPRPPPPQKWNGLGKRVSGCSSR